MTPTRSHLHARRASRAAALATVLLAVLVTPERGSTATTVQQGRDRSGYDWPVKPFRQQHPVRGFFGDPRIGHTDRGQSHSFHFGIDISCPNGSPVYATISGRVVLESFRPETVAVVHDDGRTEHQYWHIAPAVRNGARVVAYRTVIGHVRAPWAHVHFSELLDGAYVNPLRRGALGPYSDATKPALWSPRAESGTAGVPLDRLSGRVGLIVEVGDAHPLRVTGPWAGRPVMPAVVRWRLAQAPGGLGRWQTAVDFRLTIPANDRYDSVYARWTRQNRPGWRGRYRIVLAQTFDTHALRDGRYTLQVEAADTHGNRGVLRVPVRISNRPAGT